MVLLIAIIVLSLGIFSYLSTRNENGENYSQKYENKVIEKDSAARREAKEITIGVTDDRKLSSKAYKEISDTIREIYSIAGKEETLSQKDKIDLSYKVVLIFYLNDDISERNNKSA